MVNKQTSSETFGKSGEPGLVEVFTGDGKGKTTAALGIALRALGHNLRVYIVYFMKGGHPYGEHQVWSQLPNIDFSIFGRRHFVGPNNPGPEEIEEAGKGLEKAREVISSGRYDVVILDEINVAVSWKLIDISEVLELVRSKSRNVELILTGRYADQRLLDMADLVSEVVKVKHPYDRGILAREGIDC